MNQGPFVGQGGTQAALGPGSRVAGYLLERQIGAGGMAVVYQARDIRLGRLVALKVMAPAVAGDETYRLRFVREAQTAAAVDDPHIIPVYEAGEVDGVLFIAMRFVGGGDLRSLLRREGPLPPDRVLSAISSVASALDTAHAAGLVHRDVKPANMLRDTRPGRPDHVYLSDFGLSKGMQSSHLTGSGQFFGTPDYTAPEQIAGEAADGRTDQYALACSAFELLTGTVPFGRPESWQTVWAHMNTPPPTLTALRPDLPLAADSVLAWAMAKSPQERFASCRAFADALGTTLRTGRLPATLPPAGLATVDFAIPTFEPRGYDTRGFDTPGFETRGPATRSFDSQGADTRGPATRSPETPDSATPGFATPGSAPPGLGNSSPSTLGATKAGLTGAGTLATNAEGVPGVTNGGRGGWSRRRRRVIVLAAAVVACAGAAAGLVVPRLTASTTSASGGQLMSANPSMFGLAEEFTPPTTAGSWQEVTSVAFSPDGKSLAVGLTTGGTNSYSPSSFGGEIYMFNRATLKQSTYMLLAGGTVTFSADGQLLAAAGGTGQHQVYLVNSVSGGGAALPPIAGFGGQRIKSLAFSPDGQLLAATDTSGGFNLWSTATRRPIDTQLSGQSVSNAIAFSPDGDTIAVGESGEISLWDTDSGSMDDTIEVPGNGSVGPVAYSPDGKLLVAALPDGRIGLWGADTQRRLGILHDTGSQGTESVAVSPDGRMLAVGDGNGKTYLWDLPTEKLVATLTNPVGPVPAGLGTQPPHAVDSVAFSPDGKTLATSDTDGSAYLWRVG